jgi:hypothetical protein
MNIEQAKAAIKDAMQWFEGEGWDDTELSKIFYFLQKEQANGANAITGTVVKVDVQEALRAAHKHVARYI